MRPTIFVAPPRVYQRLYQRVRWGVGEELLRRQGTRLISLRNLASPRHRLQVFDKVSKTGGVGATLFNYAYAAKLHHLHASGTAKHALWDAIVFRRVASTMGLDRCRIFVTGSAPIAGYVKDFIRVVFSRGALCGCKIGLLPLAAYASLRVWSQLSPRALGRPRAAARAAPPPRTTWL